MDTNYTERFTKPLYRPTLSKRIRSLAARWAFDADETALSVADAARDPAAWHVRLERDETAHGHCMLPLRAF